MSVNALTINMGSSSLKFSMFEAVPPGGLVCRFRGRIDDLHASPQFEVKDSHRRVIEEAVWGGNYAGHEAAFSHLLEWLRTAGFLKPDAVGHRIVHGGDAFNTPVLLNDDVLRALDELVPLAPLHQPHNLSAVRVLRRLAPEVPQVACFDTALHSTLRPPAMQFALPLRLQKTGIHRFGFHGLSYEYVARELRRLSPETAAGRVIIAHLGAGATLCAMENGLSVDTTTGLSALDGLPMGTRCGAIDPGVLLYLLQEKGYTIKQLEHLLYQESGLLGMSGISADMRDLLVSSDPAASDAIDYFVFRTAREIAALTSSLGGLDAIVFTGGIGENAAPIRTWIVERLHWLGLELDEAINARNDALISKASSRVSVWVIATDEERMVAEHTLEVVSWLTHGNVSGALTLSAH